MDATPHPRRRPARHATADRPPAFPDSGVDGTARGGRGRPRHAGGRQAARPLQPTRLSFPGRTFPGGRASRPRPWSWAERGLRAFPDLPDRVGLRDFVAAAYHRQGSHDEAANLAWDEFARFSDLEHYRKLQGHARQGGDADWPRWRERALVAPARHAPHASSRDTLVEILLADGDADAAWAEASTRRMFTPDLWLRLARHREKTASRRRVARLPAADRTVLARGGQPPTKRRRAW